MSQLLMGTICELIIAKHRNGSLGTIKVKWVPEITLFVDCGLASEDGEDEVVKPTQPEMVPPPMPDEMVPPPEEISMTEIDVSDIDDKF